MSKNTDPIFNSTRIKAVPVIASFDSDGNSIPIYASINGERYKIESAKLSKVESTYLYYKCNIIVDELMKQFELIYSKSHVAWFVPVEYLRS